MIYPFGLISAYILSVIYVILLRWFVKSVMYTTFVIIGIITVIYLVVKIQNCRKEYCEVIKIFCLSFILVIYLIFHFVFRKEIKNSCECIREACK